MSDNDYYEESRSTRLMFWGLGQMLKGAGWAMAILLSIIIVMWGIWAIGQLLPPESKQAPAPMGAIEAPASVTRIA